MQKVVRCKARANKRCLHAILSQHCQKQIGIIYSKCIFGDALNIKEADRIKNTRSINAVCKKISPASVEDVAMMHIKQLIMMCLFMNGRNSKKYLLQLCLYWFTAVALGCVSNNLKFQNSSTRQCKAFNSHRQIYSLQCSEITKFVFLFQTSSTILWVMK